jgi:hypothetical protein
MATNLLHLTKEYESRFPFMGVLLKIFFKDELYAIV